MEQVPLDLGPKRRSGPMFHLAGPSSSSHCPSLITGQRGKVDQQTWLLSFSPTEGSALSTGGLAFWELPASDLLHLT